MSRAVTTRALARVVGAGDHDRLLFLVAMTIADDFGRGRVSRVHAWCRFGDDPPYAAGLWASCEHRLVVRRYGADCYVCPSWFEDVEPATPCRLSTLPEPPEAPELATYHGASRGHSDRIASQEAFEIHRRTINREIAAGFAPPVEALQLHRFVIANGGTWSSGARRDWNTLYHGHGPELLAATLAKLKPLYRHIRPDHVVAELYRPRHQRTP